GGPERDRGAAKPAEIERVNALGRGQLVHAPQVLIQQCVDGRTREAVDSDLHGKPPRRAASGRRRRATRTQIIAAISGARNSRPPPTPRSWNAGHRTPRWGHSP